MPKYKLISPYWDGRNMFEKGTVMTFEQGKAPKSAKLLDAPAPMIEPVDDEPATEGPVKEPDDEKAPAKTGAVKVVDKK